MCEMEASSWRLTGYFLLIASYCCHFGGKKIKWNCFIHTQTPTHIFLLLQHNEEVTVGAHAWTRTCRGRALTFSSRYPITRKPFPPSICSCMATELFSSSTRNASRVALQDTLGYSPFCMFPLYASLFPLPSGCILICDHCLLVN